MLRGPEARLFAQGVLALLPHLGEKGDTPDASAAVFYELNRSQQLVVLCQVVEAIFRRSVPVPEHLAVNEAAIAAVFDSVRDLLEQELDTVSSEESGPIRGLLRRVLWKAGKTAPDACIDDAQSWDPFLDEITDLILWDRDFEPDMRDLMAMGQIKIPYFQNQPGAPSDEMAAVLEDRIRAVCEAIV